MNKPLLCLLLATAAGLCQSQPVWRCGADGRSYSDTPCADGQVVALADLPRRAGGTVETPVDIAMIREQRLAQQYAAQRREREREARVLRELSAGAQPSAPSLRPQATQPPARRQLTSKRQPSSAKHASRAAVREFRRVRD